ncbi:unnamed protein product, partial [Rotaria sp. Silwood2]
AKEMAARETQTTTIPQQPNSSIPPIPIPSNSTVNPIPDTSSSSSILGRFFAIGDFVRERRLYDRNGGIGDRRS